MRSRRWAYSELLVGSGAERREEELSVLAADLAVDLAELRRLQTELLDQLVHVAALEGRVRALLDGSVAAATEPVRPAIDKASRIPTLPSSPGSEPSRDDAALFARCEGFEVESPEGLVGFVEGLRFDSRIDVPDFLEVRGGRLGRELMLIPVEAVQEISDEDERVLVRGVSPTQTDISQELVERLRKALHVMNMSLR